MLTYTFSRREKVLMVFLSIFLILVVWYQFVFTATQEQLADLTSQIDAANDQIVTDTLKIKKIDEMEDAIAKYKAEGTVPAVVPEYDNVQALMASLNAVLSGTADYDMTFEDVAVNESGLVQRGVQLSFECGSYEQARSVLDALVNSGFPCSVDEYTITDNEAQRSGNARNAGSGSGTKQQPFSVDVHLTFYEKGNDSVPADVAQATGSASGGNDLSNSLG